MKTRWILQMKIFIDFEGNGQWKEHHASHKRESRPWRIEKLRKRNLEFAKHWALKDSLPTKWGPWRHQITGLENEYVFECYSSDEKYCLKLWVSPYRT